MVWYLDEGPALGLPPNNIVSVIKVIPDVDHLGETTLVYVIQPRGPANEHTIQTADSAHIRLIQGTPEVSYNIPG